MLFSSVLFSCSSPSPSLYSFAAPLMPPVSFRSLYAMDDAGVQLAWKDLNVNETGFLLEKSSDAGASYTTLATLPPDTETYTDTDIEADSSYLYRLSVQRDTESGDPVTFTAEVDKATITPLNSTEVDVSPTMTKRAFDVRISMSEPILARATYNFYALFDIGPHLYNVGGTGVDLIQLDGATGVIDFSLFNRSNDTGATSFFLSDAVEYFDNNKESQFGKSLEFEFEEISFGVPHDFQFHLHPYPVLPAAVSGLKAEIQTDTASKTDTLTVSWTASVLSESGNNPIEGYLVEYSTSQSEDWMPVAWVREATYSVTLDVGKTLPPKTFFRVRAVNLSGLSEPVEAELQDLG